MTKQKLFVIIFCLSSLVSFAQPTSLSIASNNHERFWLYLNNTPQNNQSVESICVSNLTPNDYTIKVILDNYNRTEMSTSLRMKPSGNNYIIQYFPNENRISIESVNYAIQTTYSMSLAFVTGVMQAGMEMDAQMNGNNHGHHNNNDGHHNNNDHHGNNDGHHNNNDHHGNNDGHYNDNDHHGNNDGHYNDNGQPTPPLTPAPQIIQTPQICSGTDLEQIVRLIQDETFEDSKLTIAKQAVSSQLMTTDQLTRIARLFTYEDTKLEFLKYAYDYCFDKNKYYLVNSVFTYSSSKDEMNEFIQERK